MSIVNWEKVREIFDKASMLCGSDREDLLNSCCGVNSEMRSEVAKLLQANEQAADERFMESSIWEQLLSKEGGRLCFSTGDQRKYRVLGSISSGGMGEVYLGQEELDGSSRKVAIKVMSRNYSADQIRHFKDEQRILFEIGSHPNLVTFFANGSLEDGRPYFVMEYVEGENLHQSLKEGPLPLGRVLNINRQLCAGLGYAHKRGVIHRDIKPSNIMLSSYGNHINAKLLDFGIAILKDDLTTGRETVGILCTPAYASPEQLAGSSRDQLNQRSDLYSLALVVYEMLTGARPGRSEMIEPGIPPSQRRPDLKIPRSIDTVIMKALALDPQARYQDVEEYARALDAAALEGGAEQRVSRRSLFPGTRRLAVAATLFMLIGAGVTYEYLSSRQTRQMPAIPESSTGSDATAGPDGLTIRPRESSRDTDKDPNPLLTSTGGTGRNVFPAAVELLRKSPSGEERVNFERVFRSGEAIRLQVNAAQKGYICLIHQGSSGDVSILYPDKRTRGYSQISTSEPWRFPSRKDDWIRFDERKGVETIHLVFSPDRDDPAFAELTSAVQKKTTSEGSTDLLNRLLLAISKSKSSLKTVQLHHQ